MCIQTHLRVRSVSKTTAVMEDGRVVKLGPLTDVSRGDYLEVYADLAIAKSDPRDARSIRRVLREDVS